MKYLNMGGKLNCVHTEGPLGNDQSIAYASRILNDSECNLSTFKNEGMALQQKC